MMMDRTAYAVPPHFKCLSSQASLANNPLKSCDHLWRRGSIHHHFPQIFSSFSRLASSNERPKVERRIQNSRGKNLWEWGQRGQNQKDFVLCSKWRGAKFTWAPRQLVHNITAWAVLSDTILNLWDPWDLCDIRKFWGISFWFFSRLFVPLYI